MVLTMGKNIKINITVDKKILSHIDKASKIENRSRSNFIVTSAVSRATSIIEGLILKEDK